MADKRIQDLTPATSVGLNDLFVLEQSGEAKSLSGQVLVTDLATALNGHGGISNITYTPPVSPSLNGTMTITMADTTQYTVTVRDGNGIASIAIAYGISSQGTTPAYVTSWSNSPVAPTDAAPYQWTRIRITDKTNTVTDAYSVSMKAANPTINVGSVTASSGVSAAATVTNSGTVYNPTLDFGFTLPKGDKGDTGDYIELVVSYGTSTAAATEPSTWYNSPTSLSYTAGNFIWQKTEYTLHNAGTVQSTAKSIIGYIGQNGSGSGTVQQITLNGTVYSDDGTGNVPITVDAADVGAIAEPSTASNGQVLTYDSSADEWVAANPSTGNVNTVNSKGVDAGTTNITLYATDIKMSSSDNTTIPNAIPAASSATPQPLGTAAAGSATAWARGDHVHAFPDYVHVGASAPSDSNIDIWLDTDEPGQSAVTSVNGANGTVVLDADDVGAMSKWVLLWTNASPTSSFATQTVQLDLSGYYFFAIEFLRTSSSTDAYVPMCIIKTDITRERNIILTTTGTIFVMRDFSHTATGILFYDCNKNNSYGSWNLTVDNTMLVPMRIWGIKGVTV